MICNRIRDIHRLSTVCFVAKNQYEPATIALAAGTACRLVSRRKLNNLMKVRLKMPSGKLKCISVAVVVFLGHIIPRKKVLLKNTRAGYWRNLGKKPQVRGIVKNSVDHPNGGRCRTLFRPRTPWGKYAK